MEVLKSVPAPAHPPWIELPWELTANILQRLPLEDLLKKAQKVCMTWRSVCQDPSNMWRKIHLCYPKPRICAGNLCRHVIDLSQGQLVELTLCGFGNDQLLQHIADRSSGSLQFLKLRDCSGMSGEGLAKATVRLPLLETLCLYNMLISGESIELVGRSCPILKSFTLKKAGSIYLRPKESDIEALAIAKTMPQLRNLCLFNNWMTNRGLEAILDACPHLESLHIDEYCPFIDLTSDLGVRCCRQIKSLKLPMKTTVYHHSC